MRVSQRRLRAEEMKKRIQTAAMELFDLYGYENVSMQEIAERAGCTAGNLYHYYKNKDAMIVQFTDHVDTVYEQLMKKVPEDLPSLQKLEWFLWRAITESGKEEVFPIGFSNALRHPELGTMGFKENRQFFRYLTDMIDECKKERSLSDSLETKEILRRFIVLQRGLLIQWIVEEKKFDLEKLAAEMVHEMISSLQ